ncbi:WEB family protein At1g12150-like [Impatiens glandulifera]|uniref:WEB family protein At1g12150-like n=1 Tax=Impatiens glandulifera TaxID=253017 RepID=UPI001FB14F98|nr:WEB family protein At1g12150-like [Impatiens glandulifera]
MTRLGSPRSGGPAVVSSPRSPKAGEVGEIDTRAPFRSVRAAVTMFGDVSSPGGEKSFIRRRGNSDERVLEKETQIHLAMKELDKYKEHLKTAEISKTQAMRDLEKANKTLQELTNKLEAASEAKQAAMETTEIAKNRARELEEAKSSQSELYGGTWKQNVDNEREQYKASSAELIAAKQELTTLRQDFDSALEKKLTAFQEAADAQHETKVNRERLTELSRQVKTMKEALNQVKTASLQARDEQAKVMAEKETNLNYLKVSKEDKEKKILALEKEILLLQGDENMEVVLEERNERIVVLQEQLNSVKESDLEAFRIARLELDEAEKLLDDLESEESSLGKLEDSLKLELESLSKKTIEIREKAEESELKAIKLKEELETHKTELELALVGEAKVNEETHEMHTRIQQLLQEAENAKKQTEETITCTKELNRETEYTLIAAKETEEKLVFALKEAEIAKAAAKIVGDRIVESSSPRPDMKKPDGIKLSNEEFELLRGKPGEFEKAADKKVAEATVQMEIRKMKEKETILKLSESLKEIEELKASIEDALKKAEMDDAAMKVVEGELQKWKENEKEQSDGDHIVGGEEETVSNSLI